MTCAKSHDLFPLSFIDVPQSAYERSCQQYVAVKLRFGIRPLELAAWKDRHGGAG